MQKAHDQLLEEMTYPHLAAFLRNGGTLEVGSDFSLGALAKIRKGNKIVYVHGKYRDVAAILNEVDSKAKEHWSELRQPQTPENK